MQPANISNIFILIVRSEDFVLAFFVLTLKLQLSNLKIISKQHLSRFIVINSKKLIMKAIITIFLSAIILISIYAGVIPNVNRIQEITIEDAITGEALVGVQVKTLDSIYYSDFDGKIKVEKSNEMDADISFISYKRKNLNLNQINIIQLSGLD